MLIDNIDKYLKQIEIVETVDSVNNMSIEELTEYIIKSDDKQHILEMLSNDRRKQVEILIEGGIL